MTTDYRRTIDKLTAYLPRFESEPCEVETNDWWPTYADYVEEFFNLAERSFNDKKYALNDQHVIQSHLINDNYIAQASLNQCRTLISFILFGERLSDGWWRDNIMSGRVQAILHRLSAIREKEAAM